MSDSGWTFPYFEFECSSYKTKVSWLSPNDINTYLFWSILKLNERANFRSKNILKQEIIDKYLKSCCLRGAFHSLRLGKAEEDGRTKFSLAPRILYLKDTNEEKEAAEKFLQQPLFFHYLKYSAHPSTLTEEWRALCFDFQSLVGQLCNKLSLKVVFSFWKLLKLSNRISIFL